MLSGADKDKEDRLRNLEEWKSNIQGKLVVVLVIGGGLWSLVVTAIVLFIKK